VLTVATVVFWTAVTGLPWADGTPDAVLTGRTLLEGLPPAALVAGGVLLVVFVAAVTLCVRPEPWLPGAALGSALTALYAAPVAVGREPRPVGGALYSWTGGFLAEAVGLGGPDALLRWAPAVLQLLCLVPLWLLLAHAGDRVSWPGRWAVLYLAAVGGWVWQQALAPVAPPLFLLLALLALLLPRRPAPAPGPPRRTRPGTGPHPGTGTGTGTGPHPGTGDASERRSGDRPDDRSRH
jgi:hypothetical protein